MDAPLRARRESAAGPQARVANDHRSIRRRCCRVRADCLRHACQLVDAVLDHVETVGSSAIQSNPITPPRRDGSGRGWSSPRGPCAALVRWNDWHSAHTRRSNPGSPRRQGAALATPSWPAQSAPRAGRCGGHGAPAHAVRRQRGCRSGPH